MGYSMWKKLRRFVYVVAVLSVNQEARALDAEYDVSAGLEYIDNVQYTPDNEISDTIRFVRGNIRLIENSRSFQSRTSGIFDYYNYVNDSYTSDTYLRLDTLNTVFLGSEKYRLNIDDHLSYVPITAENANTPDNRQQINLFSIGPFVRVDLSSTNYIELEYRYEDYYEQITDFDSTNNSVWVRLGHRTSPITQFLFGYSYRDIDFKAEGSIDYLREDGYLRYENTSAITAYYLEAGLTQITRSDNTTEEGNRFMAGISRQINPAHGIGLHYREELSSNAQELGAIRVTDPGSIPAAPGEVLTAGSAELFELSSFTLDYLINEPQTQVRLGLASSVIDYLSAAGSDENNLIFSAEYTYIFGNQSTMLVLFGYREREFVDLRRFDYVKHVNVMYSYPLRRNWTLNTNFSYEDRNSTDPGSIYEVGRLGVSLHYTTGGRAERL